MMLPPTERARLEDPRTLLELELAAIRRRLELLDRALENPLAWLALELLAFSLALPGPGAELKRLWFAEALLEAALAWYQGRDARELDEPLFVNFRAIVFGEPRELHVRADAPLCACFDRILQEIGPLVPEHHWEYRLNGELLDPTLEVGTLELAGETIHVFPRAGFGG